MKSILFSLWQTVLVLDWREAIPDICRAARAIVRAWIASRHQNNSELQILRSSHCRLCPFYDARWRTCGTPGEIHPRDDTCFPPIKIGCWCYLPLANFDPTKDCYARANGLDVGWPDGLRPKLDPKLNLARRLTRHKSE